MIPCKDESAFQWIRASRSELVGKYDDPNWKGVSVSVALPAMFESYVKILHRLQAHDDTIDSSLSSEELSILNIPNCTSLRSLAETYRDKTSRRIRWKEVADRLGFSFESGIVDDWFRTVIEPGCWPRFINGPGDGWLDPEDGDSLIRILRKTTDRDPIYLRMAEIPPVATNTPLLYDGDFDDVLRLLRAEGNSMLPEYWWPRDHSWCVCSDYDLTFTLVGASTEVCQHLLDDEIFECIEVAPETRVDYGSPPQRLR